MSSRLTLQRSDGRVFLDRWGWECKRFGIFLHHIGAPDPGVDLHNHPWPFVSFVVWGGYKEVRANHDYAMLFAAAELDDRGFLRKRLLWTFKRFRMEDAHRIISVKRHTWTIVFRGRARRPWGFYTPDGYMTAKEYENSYWGRIRELSEVRP
jgi:hypothetical protein